MSDYVVSDTNLAAVADAIRAKGGTSSPLAFPTDFVTAIAAIPSGGGLTNVVTGTFEITSTNTILDFSTDYSGNGYPVVFLCYPDDDSYITLVRQYALGRFAAFKRYPSLTPSYSENGNNDTADIVYSYKKDSSSDVYYMSGGSNVNTYSNNNPYESTGAFKIKGKNLFSARTGLPGRVTFVPNLTYRYYVIYSE